jgi:predicted O-methyltransferase YrrM
MELLEEYNRFFKNYFYRLGSLRTIVETGTTRQKHNWHGDGCSTIIYADFCAQFKNQKASPHVWTCDISKENIEMCKEVTKEYKEHITYVVDDSINFLSKFDDPIDFLYLDSYDASKGKDILASEHNLKEAKISIDKLHESSVILLDDSRVNGEKIGKGIYSIPYLKDNGWKLLNEKWGGLQCQALFVREESI